MAARPRRRAMIAVAATIVSAGAAFLPHLDDRAAAAGPLALTQPPDPFIGSLTPASDADTKGMYSPVVNWPMIPIHVAVMPDGNLLSFGAPPGAIGLYGVQYDTWKPALGTSAAAHSVSEPYAMDSFCSIGALTDGGDYFVIGGNYELKSGVYRYSNKSFSLRPELTYPRWYASMTRLPDNRVVVVGGAKPYPGAEPDLSKVATTPEIFDGTSWQPLSGAGSTELFSGTLNRWWYPRTYLAPDGSIFGISRERMWRLDPDTPSAGGAGSITYLGDLDSQGVGASTSSVMYAPGKILQAGGGQVANGYSYAGSTDARIIDINGASPAVSTTGSLTDGRNWLNLTVLPNGEVLANGGTGQAETEASSRYRVETWNPTSGQWRFGAAAARVRTYHSSALLMPSGSVFTGGSGGLESIVSNLDAEFYLPSYLFDRDGSGHVVWANRPEFRSVIGTIAHGNSIVTGMKDSRSIASVSLTTASSVTHSMSVEQRRIPLSFTQSGANVTIALPGSETVAPPGYYLLQAVDTNGTPAPAQLIELRSDGAPGTITVYGSGPQLPPDSGGTVPTTTPTTVSTTTATTVPTTAPTTSPSTAPTTVPTTAPTTSPSTVPTTAATTTKPTTSAPPTTRPRNPLLNGLVAGYRFDTGSGTTAVDYSGNRNHGKLINGAVWGVGKSIKAARLPGTNDSHIRVAPSTSINSMSTKFTIAAWVAPAKRSSSWMSLASRQIGTSVADQWNLGLRDGRPGIALTTGSGSTAIMVAPKPIPTNVWTHVVATYDGTTMRLYVNGVLVRAAAKKGTLRSSNRSVVIGGNQNGASLSSVGQLLAGRLDDLRLYRRALTSAEVKTLYARNAS